MIANEPRGIDRGETGFQDRAGRAAEIASGHTPSVAKGAASRFDPARTPRRKATVPAAPIIAALSVVRLRGGTNNGTDIASISVFVSFLNREFAATPPVR